MGLQYTIFNKQTGEIVRSGQCPNSGYRIQKFDPETEMITPQHSNNLDHVFEVQDGKAIKKDRPAQAKAALKEKMNPKRPVIPHGQRRARITNDQLASILSRLDVLEQ